MNRKKINYRIPFGFKDYFKNSQKISQNSEIIIIQDSFIVELKSKNAKNLARYINILIEKYFILLNENNIKKLSDLLIKIDDMRIVNLKDEDDKLIFQVGHSEIHLVFISNETEIKLNITAEYDKISEQIEELLATIDEFFVSTQNLVYKYLYLENKLYAFSNFNQEWSKDICGFIGVDVGSVSTNVIFLDDQDNVIETVYTYTRGRVLDAIKTSFADIQKKLPLNSEILGVGVTGSSGELAKLILNADLYRTEIYSHASATIHQIPDVKTIMEIGGQDSKVIYVNNGIPEKSKMNEWCGAGTGAMLDAQSHRLGIPINEFGDYALNAKKSIDFRTRCGVFMDSCMIDAQAKGYPIETIVSGLCKACAKNFINTLGINRKKLGTPISFQGGVASNKGVKKELENYISESRGEECELIVPLYHKVMGAIGIALITAKFHRKRNTITNFRGYEDIFRISSEVIQCDAEVCPKNYQGDNCCDIVKLHMNSDVIAAIGACDEYNDDIMHRKSEDEETVETSRL